MIIDVIGSGEETPYFEDDPTPVTLDEGLPFNTTVTVLTAVVPEPGLKKDRSKTANKHTNKQNKQYILSSVEL